MQSLLAATRGLVELAMALKSPPPAPAPSDGGTIVAPRSGRMPMVTLLEVRFQVRSRPASAH